MLQQFEARSSQRTQFLDITDNVQHAVKQSSVREGTCRIYVPHTTAGITINENADPAVRADLAVIMDKLVPQSSQYSHAEGNSDAHAKASLMGFDAVVFVENGRLVLGTWQGIYLAEFDGPRTRKIFIKVESDA